MKKLFTLMVALASSVAIFAADHNPAVMLRNSSSRNFRVVIDGRSYDQAQARIEMGNSYGYNNGYDRVSDRGNGYDNRINSRRQIHTVSVYQVSRGFFKRQILVDSKTFTLDRNDVMVMVDWRGDIRIQEMGGGRDGGRDRYDNDNDRRVENGRRDDDDHRINR